MPIAIFTNAPDTGFTGELGIKAFFNAFNSLPVNIGKANQISGDVACRIKTA